MKLRILIGVLLLGIACTAQIDYNSQIKNKITTTGLSANAILWTGPVDPGLNVLPVKYVNTKLVGGTSTVTTNWSVTTGDLLIVEYNGDAYSLTTRSTGATDTFGSVFTKHTLNPSGNTVYTGTASGSGIDTINITGAVQGLYGATIAVSEFSGATNVLDDSNSTYNSNAGGYINTTVFGDLIYYISTFEASQVNDTFGPNYYAALPLIQIGSDWTQLQAGTFIMYQVTGTVGSYNNFSPYAHYNARSVTLAFKAQTTPIVGSHNGDYYINSVTNVLFGPKAGNIWPTIGMPLKVPQLSLNVVLSGTLNGTNPTFTIPRTPLAGTLMVFRNGSLQTMGTAYTLSTNTITFLPTFIPTTGDVLTALYQY